MAEKAPPGSGEFEMSLPISSPISLRRAVFLAILLAGSNPWGRSALVWAASGAGALVSQVPCLEAFGIKAGLRSCEDVVDGKAPPEGVVPLVEKHIADYIETLYKTNLEPHPFGPDTKIEFGPTVCSLVPGAHTRGSSEVLSDHNGKGCGRPYGVSVKRKLTGGKIQLDQTNGQGTREQGYFRGAYLAALACFEAEVTNEIRSTRKLTVKSAACRQLAEDYQTLGNLVHQRAETLIISANIDDIENAKKSWDPSKGPKPDVGELRQSAQQLAAARSSIEATFAYLGACEVFARASDAYLRLVSNPQATDQIHKELFQSLSSSCKSCDRSPAPGPSSTPLTDSEIEGYLNQGSACLQICYEREMPTFLRRKFEGFWPAVGACQGFTTSDARTRSPEPGRRELVLAGAPLLMLVLLLLSLLGSGCKIDPADTPSFSTTAQVTYCQDDGMIASRLQTLSQVCPPESKPKRWFWEWDGHFINKWQEKCQAMSASGRLPAPSPSASPQLTCRSTSAPPGAAPTVTNLGNGVRSATTAATALGAARSLEAGRKLTNQETGMNDPARLISSNAMARDGAFPQTVASAQPSAESPTSANDGETTAPVGTALNSKRRAGSVAESGPGFSGIGGLGGVSTGVATESSDLQTEIARYNRSKDENPAEGDYKASAVGGAERPRGADSSPFGADGLRSASAGADSELGFDRDPASQNINPMGTPDPADYFQRTNSGLTLFEIVSHRYRVTALKWPLDSSRPAPKGP